VGHGADDARDIFQDNSHGRRPTSQAMRWVPVRTSTIASSKTGFKDASPFANVAFTFGEFLSNPI
jgi:hypothetical protein